MAIAGCQNSGNITTSSVVYRDGCRLVSVHVTNTHAADTTTVAIYDNSSAASGKLVLMMNVEAGKSLEYDMHSAKMLNGIYVSLTNGTGNVQVNFA